MKYISQQDYTDCGPACIAMIASHYKSKHSIANIREISGTDKNGTNINGILIAADKLGFSANAVKGDKQSITKELSVPFIAHLKVQNEEYTIDHYVVVKSINKNHIRIFNPDPYEGKVNYSIEKFIKLWTGYAVFIAPKFSYIPINNVKNTFSRFIPFIKPHIKLLSQILIISLILILFGIISSQYLKFLIDDVIYTNAKNTLIAFSTGVICISLFQVILESIRAFLMTLISMKIDYHIIFSYFQHVMNLPISFFDKRKTGEILSRMQDAKIIRTALTEASISIVMDSLMIILIGIALFLQAKSLFGIALIIVPASTIVIWSFAKPLSYKYRELMSNTSEVHSYLVEALNGYETIKALNAPSLVFQEYEKRQVKALWTNYKLFNLQNIRDVIAGIMDSWTGYIILWIGCYYIMKDTMTLGELLSFNALLGYFLGPLRRLLSLQPNLQEAFVAADRLGEILDLDVEIKKEGKWIKKEKINGSIRMINVTFRYGTRKTVLNNINLSIFPGQWVAFVGASGCGKTSLVKLLLKFYKPEKGEILLDDNNINDIDTTFLRSRIGYVPQDIFLFSGTIAENISLHKPESTLEEIIKSAKLAKAHDFIITQPDRYNTEISERGTTLSGGERQRIALARALLGNPELLIFDEATSNLDSFSEQQIHETLISLKSTNITTILIAHRLTTIVNCDQIFVMNNGNIIEHGSHIELIKKNGYYKEMWAGNNNK